MKFAWILFAGLFLTSVSRADLPEVKLLRKLNKIEAYAPLAFNGGHLWLGKTQFEGVPRPEYFIEAYDASGEQLIASAKLAHSVENLYPFGSDQVLMVGKTSATGSWFTYYTIARLKGSQVAFTTKRFSEEIQTEQFGGFPGKLFFNEPGEAKIFTIYGSGTRFLKPTLSGPGAMAVVGNSLFVLERRSFELGDENLVKIDLDTEDAVRLFPSSRNGLVSLNVLNDGQTLALSETLSNQVLLVDGKSGKLTQTIGIPAGSPRTINEVGHCLVVGSFSPAKLSIVDTAKPDKNVVEEWDLSTYGPTFANLKTAAVNPKTGSLFLRSQDICGSCTESRNAVYRVTGSSLTGNCLE